MVRFLVRNPIRDRWKDYLRMQKLMVVVGTLSDDVAKEKNGLQRRYETAMAEAAFSMDALADPNMPPPRRTGVDGMAESLNRYSDRIAQLEQQLTFFGEIQNSLHGFMQEHEIDATPQS